MGFNEALASIRFRSSGVRNICNREYALLCFMREDCVRAWTCAVEKKVLPFSFEDPQYTCVFSQYTQYTCVFSVFQIRILTLVSSLK